MPGSDVYRAIAFRLQEISRGTVGEPWRRIRVALELSIDPSNLVGQPLFSMFLTRWAEPKIDAHAPVSLSIMRGPWRSILIPGVRVRAMIFLLPRKAGILGTVVQERNSGGCKAHVRERIHVDIETGRFREMTIRHDD